MNKKFAKSSYFNFLLWGVLSSLGITVSTFVDAFFIGNFIGNDGLAVSNISTPLFLIYQVIGVILGVGANVIIGRLLGEGDSDSANKTFKKVFTLGIAISIVTLVVLVVFRDGVMFLLGVNESLKPMAAQYQNTVMFSAPIFILYHILSTSVRTDSDPRLASVSSAVVIVTNIVLDYLFMRVLGWGIAGASAALCIAEFLGTIVLLTHFFKKRSLLRLGFSLPRFSNVKDFILNGFGVGSAYIFQAVVMSIFNKLLITSDAVNGVTYVAIFGVIYTISMVPFAVFDGASNALYTVTTFFTGEKDVDGIMAVLRYGVIFVIASGVVLGVACFTLAPALTTFFELTGEDTLKISTEAIRIFAASIVFTGINTVIVTFWQAIGRAKLSAIISILRNFLIMIVIGAFAITNYKINGLSLTYLWAEQICLAIALVITFVSSSKKYVNKNFSVDGHCFENNYIIRTESMENISRDIEAICDGWEIPPGQGMLINLIAEELLLNIIKFGLGDDSSEHYIDIRIVQSGEDYIVRIRDNVKSYNPFEANGDEIDMGILKLISMRSKEYTYQRKLIFNYLYFVV